MKHSIDCIIEAITFPGESAWNITIAAEDVSDAIVLMTALQYGKLSQIKLTDHHKTAVIRNNSLLLDDIPVSITATWLEAVLSMLLDIQLNGWTTTAHLDQDFAATQGNICVCFAVAPPK